MFANAAFGRFQVDHAISALHRSVASHEEIKVNILSYDHKYTKSIVRNIYKYRSRSFLVQDKSPGLPWTERGYKTKVCVLKNKKARNEILAPWDAIGRGRDTGLPDTAAFFRVQDVTLDNNKIRGEWGVPLDVISKEACFFLPSSLLKITTAPKAYRLEMVTGDMAYIDDMIRYHKGKPMIGLTLVDSIKQYHYGL
ncbi:unnamed protein product [Diatraea saccharalis]|uniref:Uncharacterized protein n=1 Tax=Diatraea saccharalis TaxID=40085 RepID=A0A9N9R6V2_9NEOP|nr:unnamed protein product [Diatraea saccharalis]